MFVLPCLSLFIAIQRSTGKTTPVLVGVALVCLAVGCQGPAYRDVYQQKMASEIRVLEDQLYEADYQNQVLRDQLSRAEREAVRVPVPSNRPPRSFLGKSLNQNGEVVDSGPPANSSSSTISPIDGGDSAEPSELPNELPKIDPAKTLQVEPTKESISPNELIPPAEPTPPSSNELIMPDVELGDPIPPPPADAPPEALPGKIEVPESARKLGTGPPSAPVSIRIHPGLSGGHKTDDQPAIEGLRLVIEAIDESGKPVALEQFDIDANLTIAIIDPSRPASSARLGKWEFGPDEIREMIQTDSATGLHGKGLEVVVPWGTERPLADKVIAHVRLAADEVIMQTQAELPIAQPNVAQWTPRGTSKKVNESKRRL